MISLEEKIERAQRLLRRLEEDEPLLALRVADLGREHQESAKGFAARVLLETRSELQRLLDRKSSDYDSCLPYPAD